MVKLVAKARLASNKAQPVKPNGKEIKQIQNKQGRMGALSMADLEQSEKAVGSGQWAASLMK